MRPCACLFCREFGDIQAAAVSFLSPTSQQQLAPSVGCSTRAHGGLLRSQAAVGSPQAFHGQDVILGWRAGEKLHIQKDLCQASSVSLRNCLLCLPNADLGVCVSGGHGGTRGGFSKGVELMEQGNE